VAGHALRRHGFILPLTVNGVVKYVHFDSSPPNYPGVTEFRPRLGAAFVQNDGEWNDLRIRSGLRFEIFQPNASLPSDLHNPANALPPPAPQSVPRAATTKTSVAPRIGVSYPVTRDAALFFAYGHFYQMPALGTAYNDADYRVLSTLQAGTSNYRVMGNPDIRPERTVQYQFGYKQALNENLGLEVSTFYKDIRDLLGVEFIDTYNDAQYARLTNVDFGNVVGFTLALDRRSTGLLSTTLDYTWQLAQGNASDPNETATRAQAGEDPRPRQVPFNWDQRHTLNLTVVLSRPDDFNASTILRIASGQPYTPTVASGFGGGLENNSGRKPLSITADLRGEKQVVLAGLPATAFLRVFNVFDSRFFNGAVFGSTGSPYYSRDAATDRNSLADPTRYFGPRRIELGVSLRGGDQR
jgi:outer membrane receptor protein involved in Fe transport